MEFKVQHLPAIEPIRFNYEELKAELTARVSEYKTVVYTADTIKSAKADRASLNALKKAMNDERIRLEREYMQPFSDFKTKVQELCGIVDDAARAIDVQIKDFEDLKKKEKYDAVMAACQDILWNKYEWVLPQEIWNDRWLNASYSMKQVRADLEDWGKKIESDMGMLSRLPEYAFEAQETYKRTLKVEDAMWTADNLKAMDEAKKQAEAQKQQEAAREPEELPGQVRMEEYMAPPVEPDMGESEPIHVLQFRCFCTMDQAKALRDFMVGNSIKFERI